MQKIYTQNLIYRRGNYMIVPTIHGVFLWIDQEKTHLTKRVQSDL